MLWLAKPLTPPALLNPACNGAIGLKLGPDRGPTLLHDLPALFGTVRIGKDIQSTLGHQPLIDQSLKIAGVRPKFPVKEHNWNRGHFVA